jgi:hypothetical protein
MTISLKRDGVDEREPSRGSGRVRLTFSTALRVPATDPLTYEEWSRLVACPQCGASTGITLEARYSATVAICPREECGRAWPARDVFTASQIRQMNHLRLQGQDVVVPHPNNVTVNLVPDLTDDDLTLEEYPLAAGIGRPPDPVTQWSMAASAMVDQHAPPFVVALGWARGLLTWSLPADGELYEHLYPPAGGSAEDAHMVQVVLGLVIHETAFAQGIHEIKYVELEALATCLDGDRVEQLRGARPIGLRDGGRLRRSDIYRLEHATDDQWRLWCHLAGEVIAGHCESEVPMHGGKASTLPLTTRIRPWAGELSTRRPRLFQGPALDLGWYQGDFHDVLA